jgi:hypothetical protein
MVKKEGRWKYNYIIQLYVIGIRRRRRRMNYKNTKFIRSSGRMMGRIYKYYESKQASVKLWRSCSFIANIIIISSLHRVFKEEEEEEERIKRRL